METSRCDNISGYIVILTSYDDDDDDDNGNDDDDGDTDDDADDDDDNDHYHYNDVYYHDGNNHYEYIKYFYFTGSFRIFNTHQLVSSKPETNASTTSLITFISSYNSYLSTIWKDLFL